MTTEQVVNGNTQNGVNPAIEENEVRIVAHRQLRNYISYACSLIQEKGHKQVQLKGMGRAINKTVSIAEIVKRRVPGLHQNTQIGSVTILDQQENENGKVEFQRPVSVITITLSINPLETSSPGYQPPIPKEQIQLQQNVAQGISQLPYYGDVDQGRGRGGRGYGRGGRGRGGRGRGRFMGQDDPYAIPFPYGRGGYGRMTGNPFFQGRGGRAFGGLPRGAPYMGGLPFPNGRNGGRGRGFGGRGRQPFRGGRGGRFGEGRFGEGRFGEGRFGEGRFGEGRFGEGRFGGGRVMEGQQVQLADNIQPYSIAMPDGMINGQMQ